MKKYWIIVIAIVLIISVMLYSNHKKYRIVALGDSLAFGREAYKKNGQSFTDYVGNYYQKKKRLENFNKKFAVSGYRISDLLTDINNNKYYYDNRKKVHIKSTIHNADIILISIGANDMFYKLGLSNLTTNIDKITNINMFIDDIIVEMDSLLNEITKLNNKKIYIINYYNPVSRFGVKIINNNQDPFLYANQELKKLTNVYQIEYVDVYRLFNNNPSYLPNKFDIHPGKKGYRAISNLIINSNTLPSWKKFDTILPRITMG